MMCYYIYIPLFPIFTQSVNAIDVTRVKYQMLYVEWRMSNVKFLVLNVKCRMCKARYQMSNENDRLILIDAM